MVIDMATPEEQELLNRFAGKKPASVAIDPLKPIFGGETPEQITARRAEERRKGAEETRQQEAARLAQEAADRAARGETRDVEQRGFQRVGELRKEFLSMPEVRDFRNVLNSTQQIVALAQGEGSAMGDLASIFSYMKTLDPGSTVREGEAASAQNAAGIPERFRNYYNNLLSGERLSPDQRADMANTAITLYKSRAGNYNSLANTYRGLLNSQGANPDENGVVLAPELTFQPAGQPPAAGTGEGPNVTVTPEDSIATFGQLTYDSKGNLVGRAYQESGGDIYNAQGQFLGLVGTVVGELQTAAPSFYESALDAVTGADRSTATTERLPDWVQMPGINDLLSSAAWKTGLGTAFGGSPQEIAQIVQANFPGTQVYQDEKGNYILRSAIDGKDYAIKPGFQISDIPRAGNIIGLGLLGGGGAGVTALQTAGREALMQTGIEAAQAGTGGTFNPSDIATAAALGGGAQRGLEVLPGAAGRMVGRMMGNAPAMPSAAGMGEDFVRELPGGIPLPGGGISAAPAGGSPMGGTPAAAMPTPTEVVPTGMPTGGAAPEIGGTRGSAGAMSTSEETIRAQRALELPIPIELARFQRTRNFAEQQRARELAKNNEVGGPIRERMTQQQDALRQNFERFIEGTGSQVWENPYEQGGVIADALGTLAKRERTKINALYKRADAAGETMEPVGYQDVVAFINEQTPTTRDKLAPVLNAVKEEIAKNDPTNSGTVTLKAMEDVRKLINRVSQPGTPDAEFGRQMKQIIDASTEGAGGDVYKRARAARSKYAQDFENIDLVQKVFDNKPNTAERYIALEKVTDRISGANTPLDSVNHLLGLLDRAGPRGERAKRELQGAIMEKIRDQAYRGITTDEAGGTVIQPAALNKIVTDLDRTGKLDVIFDRKTADLLRTVNDVTKDIVTAPPGSVNASGTSSAVMNAIDTMATFGTTGIPVPAAKILNEFRKAMANRGLRKEVKRLLD